MRKIYIYIVGVGLLGLIQGFFEKGAIGSWFFWSAIIYLVALRWVSEKYGRA
jgi:hypothetical protein